MGGVAAAVVEGTLLADYRFDRHKSTPRRDAAKQAQEPPKHLTQLIVAAPGATDATWWSAR